MTLTRSTTSNNYCVPTALALLTGLSVDEVTEHIQEHLGNVQITGVFPGIAVIVLRSLGYECRNLEPFNMTLNQIAERAKLNNVGIIGSKYLIEIPRHVLVLQGDKVWDSLYPTGKLVKEYPNKRAKVLRMWEVR